VFVACGLALTIAACRAPSPSIAEPRLDGVEPAVAQAIRARHAAVVAQPDDGERWGRYGMALDAHGLDTAAEAAYERAAALDPQEFRWPYFHAALLEATSLERGAELYRRALAIREDYAPAHLRLAQALERLNRRDEARRSYLRAQELDPDNAFAPLGLGSLALRQGDIAAAIALLEQAYGLDPEIHATVSALANAYHRAGETERGRRLAIEARDLPRITYQPDDLRAEIKEAAVDRRSYVRRAVVYRDVGQLDRALREARSARSLAPQDVQTVVLVADLEYRLGDFAAAETSAREALRLAPGRTDVLELLARVLFQRGALDEAAAVAEQVLAEQEQANMHVLLGRVAGQRGNDVEAIRHLERAVQLRPQETEWRFTLARLLIAVGREEDGRGHLLRLVASNPEHSAAWNELGQVELARGERAAAERAFERAHQTVGSKRGS
jgi:tetratricopeptide (TPR) repeat protein